MFPIVVVEARHMIDDIRIEEVDANDPKMGLVLVAEVERVDLVDATCL